MMAALTKGVPSVLGAEGTQDVAWPTVRTTPDYLKGITRFRHSSLDRAHEALSGGIGVECSELWRVLKDQQQGADTLKQEQGIIMRYVFCYTMG